MMNDILPTTDRFRILEAPEGPGTVAEKVRAILSPAVVVEYGTPGRAQPIMKVLGGEKSDHLDKLYEADFETMSPPFISRFFRPSLGEFG